VNLLLPFLAFLFASLVVTAVALAVAPDSTAKIDRRLGEVIAAGAAPSADRGYERSLLGALTKIGSMAPRPVTEMSKLRRRLVAAGFRGSGALIVFLGIRVGTALGAFGLFLVLPAFVPSRLMQPSLMRALIACALGYVLPGMVLARKAKSRQHRIRLGLPDALDLLVVSVEAGLGLDQAVQRVGAELAFAHPDLCDELRLINLELRAGKARSEALHNLAERTGVDDIRALVTMLVQTDKFGTSVAQSLRVHSDTVRTKRRQRAEEAAAKTGVKMVFPLVLCIFPSIFVVTLAPAAIKFMQVLGQMAK
jgi:tight adherence protein C